MTRFGKRGPCGFAAAIALGVVCALGFQGEVSAQISILTVTPNRPPITNVPVRPTVPTVPPRTPAVPPRTPSVPIATPAPAPAPTPVAAAPRMPVVTPGPGDLVPRVTPGAVIQTVPRVLMYNTPSTPRYETEIVDGPPRRHIRRTIEHQNGDQGQVGRRTPSRVARSAPPPPPPGLPPQGETRFVPNEVLIELRGSIAPAAIDALLRRQALTRLDTTTFAFADLSLVRVRINGGRSVRTAITSLAREQAVAFVQPNYIYGLQQEPPAQPAQTAAATTTADPASSEPLAATPPAAPQPLSAPPTPTPAAGTTQAAPAGDPLQYAIGHLHIREAHDLATGDRVVVALIDSGVDASHPELADVVVSRLDTLSLEFKPHSHGTGMAGAIGAHVRLLGIAPAARIVAIRAFSGFASAPGAEGTTWHLMKSLELAIGANARVINMSFAGPVDPVMARGLEAAAQKHIVLVAASGNAGPRSPPLFPASDPHVIAVTATDGEDHLFDRAVRGPHIAVAAPGVDVLVPAPGASYDMTSGTSVSSAQVSGVAALLIQRDGRLDPDGVRRIMTFTAHPIQGLPQPNIAGAGLIDAFAAVSAISRQQ